MAGEEHSSGCYPLKARHLRRGCLRPVGCFPKSGVPLRGPCSKDYSIVRVYWGPFILGNYHQPNRIPAVLLGSTANKTQFPE